MKNNITIHISYSIVILLFLSTLKINAQGFGFGCLGLSGVYGGYSYQDYKADGLNSYISSIAANANQNKQTFKRAEGIRVGANIFRAKFSNYFLTVKGFYQFLKETKTVDVATSVPSGNEQFELKLDYWGFGADFGFSVFNFLDWKLLEGGVTFYNINLKNSYTPVGSAIVENKYSEPKATISYYAASGIILHLVKDYISIEGTAIYNFIKIPSLKKDSGSGPNSIPNNNLNLIERGGLSVSVQLNLGFPL